MPGSGGTSNSSMSPLIVKGLILTSRPHHHRTKGRHAKRRGRPSAPHHRLQALEGQALGVLDAGQIQPADEGHGRLAVAIGQRNNGIDGNSLGVHGLPRAVSRLKPQKLKPQNLKPQNLKPQNLKPQNLNPQNLKPQNLNPQNLNPSTLTAPA